MKQRTDIHRPSQEGFDPQEYRLIHVADTLREDDDARIYKNVTALEEEDYILGAGHSQQCGHCGTHMRYHALLAHPASREYIYVGEECLGKRFQLTKRQFADMRKRTAALKKGEELDIDLRTPEEVETQQKEAAQRHRSQVDEVMMKTIKQEPILAYLMYKEADQFLPQGLRRDAQRFRANGQLSPYAKTQLTNWLTRTMARQARIDNPEAHTIQLNDTERVALTGTLTAPPKPTNTHQSRIILTNLRGRDNVPVEGHPTLYVNAPNKIAQDLDKDDTITVTVTVQHGRKAGIIFGNQPIFHNQKG